MKVGVFSVILRALKFEQTLDYLAGLGVQAIELGAGGYAGMTIARWMNCSPATGRRKIL